MDFDEWEDGEIPHDCGLLLNGQCLLAGSEECDWDCPNSHGPFYAGSECWHKRHNEGVPIEGCECSECRTAALAKARGETE